MNRFRLDRCTSCSEQVSTGEQVPMCTTCGGTCTRLANLALIASGVEWAGCNYHANSGNNVHEPFGTAQSMHDCMDCHRLSYCTVKRPAETWELTDEWMRGFSTKWMEVLARERTTEQS